MKRIIVKRDVRTATEVDAFVGAQLKAMRKSANLTQSELAKHVSVTFQQIQKYERGTNRIGASRLWEFCKVFDVKPGRFFDGVENHLSKSKAPEHGDLPFRQIQPVARGRNSSF